MALPRPYNWFYPFLLACLPRSNKDLLMTILYQCPYDNQLYNRFMSIRRYDKPTLETFDINHQSLQHIKFDNLLWKKNNLQKSMGLVIPLCCWDDTICCIYISLVRGASKQGNLIIVSFAPLKGATKPSSLRFGLFCHCAVQCATPPSPPRLPLFPLPFSNDYRGNFYQPYFSPPFSCCYFSPPFAIFSQPDIQFCPW